MRTSYKLFYWPFRGRGEQIRVLLNELGADFEDVYIRKDVEFPTLRKSGTGTLAFGSVPMLEDGGFKLVQGPVIMNYLGRKHGLMPKDLQASAQAEALVLGAEDMRMAFFRLLGNSERIAEKREQFLAGDWVTRWLPAWDGLLELNGDSGFLVGPTLTQADIAAWDAIDGIMTWIDGASFGIHGRVERFYETIAKRPRIASYLASDRRIPRKN